MIDPFENEDASYLVLVNDENQHSLWPEVIDVPPGWRVVFGGSRRPQCLEYIEANWTDIRPASLLARAAVGSEGSSPRASTAGGFGGSSPRASTAGGFGGSSPRASTDT